LRLFISIVVAFGERIVRLQLVVGIVQLDPSSPEPDTGHIDLVVDSMELEDSY
jgi:hypothetical protein